MRLSSEPGVWHKDEHDKQVSHLVRLRRLAAAIFCLLAGMALALATGATQRAYAEAWDAGVGSTVYFGSYWQEPVLSPALDRRIRQYAERVDDMRILDGVTYRVKGDYYYYKDPIEWKVLADEGDTLLLLSDEVLDYRSYSSAYESNWDTSGVRSWLNDFFLNNAFSEEERSYIPVSNNSFLHYTYDEWRTRTGGSYMTSSEQVFLLDRMDIDAGLLDNAGVTTVGFVTKFVDSKSNIYAWWLRGDKDYSYGNQVNQYINTEGSFESWYPTWDRGIRPAIRVNKGAPSLTTKEPEKRAEDMTKMDKRSYPDYANLYRSLGWTTRVDETHYQWRDPNNSSGRKERYNALYALTSNGCYPLPGLTYTHVDDAYCDAMVPQGLCVTDKYIIVSAYCGWSGDKGLQKSLDNHKEKGGNQAFLNELKQADLHKDIETHDSVLYVLDRNNGSYIKSLALKGFGANETGNHVGGIAYDGSNLWVAMSQYKEKGKVTECRISMSDIEKEASAIHEDQQQIVRCADKDSVRVASFNTWYGGLLWIGEWTKESKNDICRLVGFEYDGSKLVERKSIKIPKSANGATFFERDDGSTYLAINRSTGRKDDTHMLVWNVGDGSLSSMPSEVDYDDARLINIPPMGEELFVEGDTIWSVYESGATLYSSVDPWKNRAEATVDQVCCGSISRLMEGDWYDPFDIINIFKTKLHIACPVDVIGYDEDGHVICIIENDQVDEYSLAHAITAYTVGDEKVIEYPSDQVYRFEIIPTDSGTMDISVFQTGDEGTPVESLARYKGLKLTEGSDYELDINSTVEEDTVPERVTLSTNGDEIEPTESIEDASAASLVTITPTVENEWRYAHGSVSDSVTVPAGEMARIQAKARDGYIFFGWFVDGRIVSRDEVYVIKAAQDLTLTARFGDESDMEEDFDLERAVIETIPDQTYTGKAITPVPKVTINGVELIAGQDFSVAYRKNTEVGQAYAIIAGEGFYTGSQTVRFNIVKKGGDDPAPATQEMHRLYNPNSGEHFYTAAVKERDALVKLGWIYEGVGWVAPVKSNTPVYRLYNKYAGDHHYTTSEKERDALKKAGWIYEAIGWYSDDAKGAPLYRQYNPNAISGSHNYTTSKQENDALVNRYGWKAEGIGWYGVKQ